MNTAAIARLKITLDDVKPLVIRRLEVPLSIRLDRLHLAIQAAMGWTNSHLYEIRAKDTGWGIPDPDWGDGPLDARKARLIDVLEDVGTKTLKYLYRAADRSRARHRLSAPDRSCRTMSTRRYRWSLGLC